MNDLERDLNDLFESKAGGVQTTPLAPPAVLRRGRRRQMGTLVGGALVAIAAAAVVIGGASAFLTDRGDPPPMGERDVLPDRTATIAGVTVTVPEGWSLLDQSALGLAIPTQVCSGTGSAKVAPDGSFTATGTPVGEGKPTAERTPTAEPTVTEECTSLDVPEGGIPVFTMGNTPPHPLQTMCEVTPELPTQMVAGDDAFLSVSLDVPAEGNAIGAAWPVSIEPEDGPCGAGLYARWSIADTGYLAVARFGPEASEADREAVMRTFEDMRFSTPTTAVPLVLGYLLDGGEVAGVPWRVVAGPNLLCESKDACGVGVAAVNGEDTGAEPKEPQMPVPPPRVGTPLIAAAEPVGDGFVVYGTADPTVRSIEIVSSEGTRTVPASVRWPDTLQGFVNADVIEGSVWWAVVDDVEQVEAALENGDVFTTLPGEKSDAIVTPAPDATSSTMTASPVPSVADLRLETRTEGNELVASGDAFGNVWELRVGPDGTLIDIAGTEPRSWSMVNDGGTRIDVPGGSVAIWQSGTDGGPLTVDVDGTGETLFGRWMPSTDNAGRQGRLWILPLPGVGSGLEWTPSSDTPMAISWPADRAPAAGVVEYSGSNGDGVAWKFAYTSSDCLVLAEVAGDPSIGSTDCLAEPTDVPLIAFAAGDQRSLVALVTHDVVDGMYSRDRDGTKVNGGCTGSQGLPSAGWGDVSACAIVIPNDTEMVIHPTVWDPQLKDQVPLDPFTVRISDGQMHLTGSPA